MDGILSVQSHVVYCYVGNKAATYPLQAMGFDVWPVHTVQFSNHTGYGKWQGEIFAAELLTRLVDGIFEIGQQQKCKAILSGYMGSSDICNAVAQIVQKFKSINKDIIYLCDPVIGNNNCYVKPEVLNFFKTNLSADIITPNHYEAEVLSGMSIKSHETIKAVADYFHNTGVRIVVITGVKFAGDEKLRVFASDGTNCYTVLTPEYNFEIPINGTGDLFSGVFLGAYIKYNNLAMALQYATFYLNKTLEATSLSKERELQVLSVRYDVVDPKLLPAIEVYKYY
jgi:pyridoxine kinase